MNESTVKVILQNKTLVFNSQYHNKSFIILLKITIIYTFWKKPGTVGFNIINNYTLQSIKKLTTV